MAPVPPPTDFEPRRRRDDRWLCWVALRASQLWDWVDKRDIDKHAVSLAIFFGTFKVTAWAMGFAEIAAGVEPTMTVRPDMGESGAVATPFEAAAIIAAVLAPYMALQAAAVKYYFETRA
jgi:hypothetical protein